MAKKATAAANPGDGALSAREFFRREAGDGADRRALAAVLGRAAREAGLAYGTVHRHVVYGTPLSVESAKKLASWSGGRISAAKTLDVA